MFKLMAATRSRNRGHRRLVKVGVAVLIASASLLLYHLGPAFSRFSIARATHANSDAISALSWSPTVVTTRKFQVFDSTIVGRQITIYESNASQAISPSITNYGCARVLRLESLADPAAESYPEELASLAIMVTPITAGLCKIALRGGSPTPRDHPLELAAQVMGDLSLSPSALVSSVKISFAGPTAASRQIVVYKTYDKEPIIPALVANGCSAIAGFYPGRGVAPAVPSSLPASTRIVVRPIRSGMCEAVLADQYGRNDRTVVVAVTVGEVPPS